MCSPTIFREHILPRRIPHAVAFPTPRRRVHLVAQIPRTHNHRVEQNPAERQQFESQFAFVSFLVVAPGRSPGALDEFVIVRTFLLPIGSHGVLDFFIGEFAVQPFSRCHHFCDGCLTHFV